MESVHSLLMSAKSSTHGLIHELPPLPKFEDERDNVSLFPSNSSPVPKSRGKVETDLESLSIKAEDELHRSDMYRKEELVQLKKQELA